MQKTNNLQEVFLAQARKQKIPVTMFLVTGISCGEPSPGLTALWSFWTARAASR